MVFEIGSHMQDNYLDPQCYKNIYIFMVECSLCEILWIGWYLSSLFVWT